MKILACLLLVACGAAAPIPDTIYRPRTGGTMDLTVNPHAQHCAALTGDFRDAYNLEDSVKRVLSIAVAPDEASMTLRTDDGIVRSSTVIGDAARLRAFWYRGDWTLAVIVDHGHCPGERCAAEIALIKYNGAQTPNDRVRKQCFERWVGVFTRVPRVGSTAERRAPR